MTRRKKSPKPLAQKNSSSSLPFGANTAKSRGVFFKVWAPLCRQVEVKLFGARHSASYPLQRNEEGHFLGQIPQAKVGDRYLYVLDGEKERPDPASRYQPEGVHGPSQIMSPEDYAWKDNSWKGLDLKDYVFYELHVGTFTPKGTFRDVIQKLPYLKKIGVTCVEVMPVAQFSGARNWGYDGVGLFAVQNSYGGPREFKKLVDACHRQGLAVCLDVVYNHFGPEGNYLHDYGPYFTDRYQTPWGSAINYDGPDSQEVRKFMVQNALYWAREFHIDALRLDAVHGIYDQSPVHILREIKTELEKFTRGSKRKIAVVAESDLNDAKIIRPVRGGGYGLDAQWSDDFHHGMHRMLTGESRGYYEDFSGVADVAKALKQAFVYDGQFSNFRQKKHGNSTEGFAGEKFVINTQNHDQVGNRAWGDRLSTLISFEAQKAAAVLMLINPNLPLLWMGQEYGEVAPFQYFVDHQDSGLIEGVRRGRKSEFQAFGWEDIPDPKSESTYLNSKLNWKLRSKKPHRYLLRLYQDLLGLRKKLSFASKPLSRLVDVRYDEAAKWLALELKLANNKKLAVIASFLQGKQTIPIPFQKKKITPLLHTDSSKYGGAKQRLPQYKEEICFEGVAAVIGKISS